MSDKDITELTQHVEDAVTYPILTKAVDGGGAGDIAVTATGALGGGSINRLARDTIRSVLGWRYREDDVKGFTAALTRSFTSRELQGRTEWEHKPQYLSVQADMGEVTGAQASIHARAKVALDQILPLLDGLKPLRPDVDEEDVEAMRSIIRTELGELVQELGIVGGPRVARVDSLFELLLGDDPNAHYGSPRDVEGQLGDLRDRLGLQRERVNTIEEEQIFTNYVIIVDYVNSLHQTWTSQRDSFLRNSTQPSLGTELVLLSQLLEVIVESVHETCAAMDSVGLGAAERRTTQLDLELGAGESSGPITIAELLGWIEEFAAYEARALIEDAGKDGIVALRHTLVRLLELVTQAWNISTASSENPVRGFHTGRVRAALGELKVHIEEAARRANILDRSTMVADVVRMPDMSQISGLEASPGQSWVGTQGMTQSIMIGGTGFVSTTRVVVGELGVENVRVEESGDCIRVDVVVPDDARPGPRTVLVRNFLGAVNCGPFTVEEKQTPTPPIDLHATILAEIAKLNAQVGASLQIRERVDGLDKAITALRGDLANLAARVPDQDRLIAVLIPEMEKSLEKKFAPKKK